MITIVIFILFNNRPIPIIQIISRKFVLLDPPLCKRPAHYEKQTNYLHRKKCRTGTPFLVLENDIGYFQKGVTWPRWAICSMLKIILVILIHIMSVVFPNILAFIVTLLILFTQEKRHIKISISCHVVPNWAIRQERAVWRHEYVRTQQQSEYDTHGSFTWWEIRFTCTYTWSYSTIILTRMPYIYDKS